MMEQNERQPLLPSGRRDHAPQSLSLGDLRVEIPTQSPDSLPGSSPGPGKSLTSTSAYILVVSRVIGSGIFATPGSIMKSAGSIGLTLVVWLIGTILAACGMAISMEYGCMLPRSGGDKVYLEHTYPRPRFLASTLIAVQAVLLGFTASNCIIFAKYTLFAFNVEPTDFQHKALAVALLTTIIIIHGRFLKAGIAIQNALGWVKIFLIGAMSLTGLWVLILRFLENSHDMFPRETASNALSWDALWEGSNWSWSLLSTAIFKVVYSYAGLNNINNVLNEVHNPVQTLKTVCPSALLTAGALYLLANTSYLLVVPIDEIKRSGELVAGLLFERLFRNNVGRKLLPLAIAISAAGNVMVVTFAHARVNQEIARQGFLPWQNLLSSSRPFGTPLGGLLVHYLPSLLVISIPPQEEVYNFILDVEGYPGQLFALAITVGLLILRYREPNRPRPFKAWLSTIWIRIVVCLVLLAAPFVPPPNWQGDVDFFYATYAIVGMSVLLFGVLYWYIWTVFLPRRGGYTLEEAVETLDDGTKVTKLIRSYSIIR